MSEKICDERHKRVDELLDEHGKRLDEHDTEINTLKVSEAVHSDQIDNLVNSIAKLVAILKWLIGILVVPLLSGIIGFFFYALQQKLL